MLVFLTLATATNSTPPPSAPAPPSAPPGPPLAPLPPSLPRPPGLLSIEVQPADSRAGALTSVDLSFTLESSLPAGSFVDFELPDGWAVDSDDFVGEAEVSLLSKDGALAGARVTLIDRAVVFQQSGLRLHLTNGTVAAGGVLAVQLAAVRLPPVASAGALTAETRNPDDTRTLDTTPAGGVVLSVAGLRNASVALADARAGATGALHLAFTTEGTTPGGSILLVCLPPGFNASAAAEVVNSTLGSRTFVIESYAGGACVELRILDTAPAGAHGLTIAGGVRAPPLPADHCGASLRVVPQDAGAAERGGPGDIGASDLERALALCVAVTPNALIAVTSTLAPPTTSAPTELRVSFVAPNPIPADGWLQLRLPPVAGVPAAAAAFSCAAADAPLVAAAVNGSLEGNLTAAGVACAAALQPGGGEIRLRRVGGGATAAGAFVELLLGGLVAPAAAGTLAAAVEVSTHAADAAAGGAIGVLIDVGAAAANLSVGAAGLAVRRVALEDSRAGVTTTLALSVHVANGLPAAAEDGAILVALPADFTLSAPTLEDGAAGGGFEPAEGGGGWQLVGQPSAASVIAKPPGGDPIAPNTTLHLLLGGVTNPPRRRTAAQLAPVDVQTLVLAPGATDASAAGVLEASVGALVPPLEVAGFANVNATLDDAHSCASTTLVVDFVPSRTVSYYDVVSLTLPPRFSLAPGWGAAVSFGGEFDATVADTPSCSLAAAAAGDCRLEVLVQRLGGPLARAGDAQSVSLTGVLTPLERSGDAALESLELPPTAGSSAARDRRRARSTSPPPGCRWRWRASPSATSPSRRRSPTRPPSSRSSRQPAPLRRRRRGAHHAARRLCLRRRRLPDRWRRRRGAVRGEFADGGAVPARGRRRGGRGARALAAGRARAAGAGGDVELRGGA